MPSARFSTLAYAALLVSAARLADAQTVLIGLESSGNVVRIDTVSGIATTIGPSGFPGANAAASDAAGDVYTIPSPTQLVRIDHTTGIGTLVATLTNQPIGYGVRGMDFDADGVLWVAMSRAETTAADLLARIDMSTGAYSMVGSMIATDVQSLAIHPATGEFFAAGVTGRFYRVNPVTGAATVISIGGGIVPDEQSLEFDAAGMLYACRTSLRTVDPVTGLATLIGLTGAADVRGLAFAGVASCYPDCDTSTGPGVLDIFDFLCFQNRYVAGAAYACDCDTSTGGGACDIFDFLCFQNAYDSGCP